MPKTIVYECPMNDHLMKTLPKSEKLILEENYKQYKALSAQKVIHNATDVMEQGSLIHNTPSVNIESMLDNGLVSGQIDIGKKVSSSSVPGNFTSTPAQFDTFKVMNSQNIKDYFNLNNRSSYERGWLPQDSKSSIVTFVINKKSISGAVENSLQYHGSPPGGQNPTHWTIPMGVPVQTVEKIIVHPSLPVSEITNIKSQIAKRGLDIKVFNTDGLLL